MESVRVQCLFKKAEEEEESQKRFTAQGTYGLTVRHMLTRSDMEEWVIRV